MSVRQGSPPPCPSPSSGGFWKVCNLSQDSTRPGRLWLGARWAQVGWGGGASGHCASAPLRPGPSTSPAGPEVGAAQTTVSTGAGSPSRRPRGPQRRTQGPGAESAHCPHLCLHSRSRAGSLVLPFHPLWDPSFSSPRSSFVSHTNTHCLGPHVSMTWSRAGQS